MFSKTDIYRFTPPGQEGDVFADPLALRRALLVGTSGRCWEWAQKAKKLEEAVAAEAGQDEPSLARRAEYSDQLAEVEGWLVGAAMQAFGLTPVDPATGHGCTELGALQLLYDFLGWLEGKGGRSGT